MFVSGLLAALALGLGDKHPEPDSTDIVTKVGAPGRFSTEVKRTEGSHEGEKCPGRLYSVQSSER